MGAAVFLADGQTDRRIDGHADMTKLIVAFRNFANAPKKWFNPCTVFTVREAHCVLCEVRPECLNIM